MNLPMHIIYWAFLSAYITKFSVTLQNLFKNEQIYLKDRVFFVNKEITGAAGTIDLLDSNSKKLNGVCNFDTNKLNEGRGGIVRKVAFRLGKDAAAGKEGAVSYKEVAPKELLNATLVLTQNGAVLIEQTVSDIHAIGTPTDGGDGYTELDSLVYMKDGDEIKIQLVFPTGVTMPSDVKYYASAQFKGVETTKKA